MACVRMTNDLRDKILSKIRSKYNTVLDVYKIPKDVNEKLHAYGEKILAEDNVAIESYLRNAMAMYVTTFGDIDDSSKNTIERNIKKAVGCSAYSGLRVALQDNEGRVLAETHVKDPNLTDSYADTYFSRAHASGVRMLDAELAEEITTINAKAGEIRGSRDKTLAYFTDLLRNVTTLKQALDVAPAMKEFVPESALDAMNAPERRYDKKQNNKPEKLDEDLANSLSTIAVHADAITALKE